MDVQTGAVMSVTSPKALPESFVKSFDALPGPKTYILDVTTGRITSIKRR